MEPDHKEKDEREIRKYTTPPPCLDILNFLPSLGSRKKVSIRLHHRSLSDSEPEITSSHLGGQLMWRSEEPKIFCKAHHQHYLPFFQLLKRDFPEIEFPDNTDLLQMFWCPNSLVNRGFLEEYVVRWVNSRDMNSSVGDRVSGRPVQHFPNLLPCTFHPERVIEYPQVELADWERQKLEEWAPDLEDDEMRLRQQEFTMSTRRKFSGGRLYDQELSVARGSKIGGYPFWSNWPDWLLPTVSDSILCPAGHAMEHLITITPWHWDFAGRRRWRPIEDARHENVSQNPASSLYMASWGLNVYMMICRICNPWTNRCIVISA